jgi:murein L,D-transpeptidase YcbB/YkuD
MHAPNVRRDLASRLVRRLAPLVAAALVAGAGASARAAADAAPGPAPIAVSVDTVLRAALPAVANAPAPAATAAVRRAVAQAWSERAFVPRYLQAGAPHEPTAEAREVLALMAAARERGLDPGAYGVDALRAAFASPPRDARAAARLEQELAFAFGRFLADLGFGRVDPATLGYDLPQQRRRSGLEPAVRAALAARSPAEAVRAIEPALPLYRPMLALLADWRARAARPEPPPLPPLPAVPRKVSPGDTWAGTAALRARLVTEGDLAAGAAPPDPASPDRYDGPLVDAVRRFQARHGLDEDGVLGARTLAELQAPAAQRVRRIELSLERIRWLGDVPRGRFVAINIPEYRLWAVDGGRVATTMRVVVGRAVTGTPVFVDAIEWLEFNPYWNVPRSIAAKELYPKMARNPGHLASQQMELIGGAGLSGAELQRALASGRARIRQLPGELNALGRVKLMMPNRHDVYLHDTPSRTLFERSRRDFSHGCVRLQHPFELAAFALAGQPEWTAERMAQAVAAGTNLRVPLKAPVPVLIFYSTVNVEPDGRGRFVPDVYGLDAKLDAALAGR